MIKEPQTLKEILMHNPITAGFVAAWGFIVSHLSVSGLTAWLSLLVTAAYATLAVLKVWDEIKRRFGK